MTMDNIQKHNYCNLPFLKWYKYFVQAVASAKEKSVGDDHSLGMPPYKQISPT
jgi:hypothetical protein